MIEERAAPRQRRSLLPNHAVSLPRTRYAPTPYGELCDSLPVELTTAEFLLHAAVAGLLPEALILASLSSTTPLPIVRRPLESELYETQVPCSPPAAPAAPAPPAPPSAPALTAAGRGRARCNVSDCPPSSAARASCWPTWASISCGRSCCATRSGGVGA